MLQWNGAGLRFVFGLDGASSGRGAKLPDEDLNSESADLMRLLWHRRIITEFSGDVDVKQNVSRAMFGSFQDCIKNEDEDADIAMTQTLVRGWRSFVREISDSPASYATFNSGLPPVHSRRTSDRSEPSLQPQKSELTTSLSISF